MWGTTGSLMRNKGIQETQLKWTNNDGNTSKGTKIKNLSNKEKSGSNKKENNWNRSGSDWNKKQGEVSVDFTDNYSSDPRKPAKKDLHSMNDFNTDIRVISATGSRGTFQRSPINSPVTPVTSVGGLTSAMTSPSPSHRQLSEYRHQLELDDGRTCLTTLSDIGSELSDSPLNDSKWSP